MRPLILAGCVLALTVASGGDAQCPGDFNGDGSVSINELITAVNNSLVGCPTPGPRFVDNGDGTITDNQTRLMWEKKVGHDNTPKSLHEVGTIYEWSGGCNGAGLI